MIKPILTYGAEIWGFQESSFTENVQNNFCKKYLKLPVCTTNAFACGECGRYPLYVDYFCKCIKYWLRLTRMNRDRIPYKCYKMLRRLDEVGRNTWATNVKNLLFSYGYGYVWMNEEVGDINMFIRAFKQRIVDCSKQDWHAKLLESDKARHYRFIMPTLQTANYLKFNLPIKYQIALSKLRCSVHKLKVETGRHDDIAYENRLCTLCDYNQVEDEFHFVMICPVYENLRITYIPSLENGERNTETFYTLFNDNYQNTLNIAMFIFHAFNLRNRV